MPVSIVVGGQFGSEGKGKVALELVRMSRDTTAVVRVGGPNSGHTAYDLGGRRWSLRQMPAAAIDRNVDVVFPPGSYLDVNLLLNEIAQLEYPLKQIRISQYARIITEEHRRWEDSAGLVEAIGSTGSGVGAAVMASVARGTKAFPLGSPQAGDIGPLQHFLCDTSAFLNEELHAGNRIVVEGTQGYGLSLLDGGFWPKSTARVTTAAGALAEAGLGPTNVDDVTLVLRSYPIRVAGDSGPLIGETTWSAIAEAARIQGDITEFTTVTNRVRRVGRFDPDLVKRAILANNPTRLVMNHLDYVGDMQSSEGKGRVQAFIRSVETVLGRRINLIGSSPLSLYWREQVL